MSILPLCVVYTLPQDLAQGDNHDEKVHKMRDFQIFLAEPRSNESGQLLSFQLAKNRSRITPH